jgi:hypothetical protein
MITHFAGSKEQGKEWAFEGEVASRSQWGYDGKC